MSSLQLGDDFADDAVFGAGREEPYLRAIAGDEDASELLLLHSDGSSQSLDVDSWVQPASAADLTVLDRTTGPMLDVGCGPGRMLHAAAARGISALGIDVAPHVVALDRFAGAHVLLRSVFDAMPLEGRWRTVLLMDGNIGIGGDPEALLDRCRELVADDGTVLVEVADDPELDIISTCTLVDESGRESAPFPWARVGWFAIGGPAAAAGLGVFEHWEADGRHFVGMSPS